MVNYWWCPNCQEEVAGSRVTFAEMHDSCGHPVTCVELSDEESVIIAKDKQIKSQQVQIDAALKACEWYAERARSLATKFDVKNPSRSGDYVLAIFTELSLDGGRRFDEMTKIIRAGGRE